MVRTILLVAAICSASIIILIIIQIAGRGLRPFFVSYEVTIGGQFYDNYRVNFFTFISGWRYFAPYYRIGYIILNTMFVSFAAVLLATPIAVLTALFIVKMASKALGNFLNTVVEVLAAIPSIIYGVFGAGYVVILVKNFAGFFGIQTAAGLSALSAILVLMMMILPTITMMSVTAIKSVDSDIEKGSLALGASQNQTYFRISLNAAKPGIFAGVILGVGRALGEATAVSLVAGNALEFNYFNPFDTTRTLTSTILIGLKETTGLDYDIRFSIGLVLIVVILGMNLLLNHMKKRMSSYHG